MELAEKILLLVAASIWFVRVIQLSIFDIREQRLPTPIIYTTLLMVVPLYVAAAIVARDPASLGWAFVGGIGPYAILLTLYLISPKLIGGGDVRFAALNGFIVGWYGLAYPWLGILAALIFAFPGSLIMVALRGGRGGQSAFGPYMALGTAAVLGIQLGYFIADKSAPF